MRVVTDDHGGFEGVRENVDGHPMVNLLAYARGYWPTLTLGVLAAFLTRFARLVPPIVVAAAIDRAIRGSADAGLLTDLGLLPPGEITGEAARLALLVECNWQCWVERFLGGLPAIHLRLPPIQR